MRSRLEVGGGGGGGARGGGGGIFSESKKMHGQNSVWKIYIYTNDRDNAAKVPKPLSNICIMPVM